MSIDGLLNIGHTGIANLDSVSVEDFVQNASLIFHLMRKHSTVLLLHTKKLSIIVGIIISLNSNIHLHSTYPLVKIRNDTETSPGTTHRIVRMSPQTSAARSSKSLMKNFPKITFCTKSSTETLSRLAIPV